MISIMLPLILAATNSVLACGKNSSTENLYRVTGAYIQPYFSDTEGRLYVNRPEGGSWRFEAVPEEGVEARAGDHGRYLPIWGRLKHEQNKSDKTYPVTYKGAGYDSVIAVVDLQRNVIVRFIDVSEIQVLCAMASESPVLLVGDVQSKTTRIFIGPSFQLAGEIPVLASFGGISVFPEDVNSFPGGFVVAGAVVEDNTESKPYLLMRLDGSKLIEWKVIRIPMPVGEYWQLALGPASRPAGAFYYCAESVLADGRWLVLRVKAAVPQQNGNMSKAEAVVGIDQVKNQTMFKKLTPGAELLNVRRVGETGIEIEVTQADSVSKMMLTAGDGMKK
jgi:hypothetical protein